MTSDLKIKVCGMRQPKNIKEVGKLGPDYLGLIFYEKSPRFVGLENYQRIVNAVPKSINLVGVFVNEALPEIIQASNLYGFKILQLHGNETPIYCKELKQLGFTIIKAFGVDESFDFKSLDAYSDCADYFLFDTKSKNHGGTGLKFDWNILSDYDNSKPLFLSGGIGAEDVQDILKLKHLNIHALDLNSRFEVKPALKDVAMLNQFINEIRA